MAQAVRTLGVIAAVLFAAAPHIQAVAVDDGPQTFTYRGIRPDDPLGRVGLRNPERGWRIETVVAQPPGGPLRGSAAHLRTTLPAAYSDLWWTDRDGRYGIILLGPIELAR